MIEERKGFEKLLKYNNEKISKKVKFYLMQYDLATEGDIIAMLELVVVYRVMGEAQLSAEWLEKAVQLGNVDAMYELGNYYFEGFGVEENYKRAFELYRTAAEKGHPDAANNLADMYLNGEGTELNEKEALCWFEIAASKQVVEAMFTLGMMYEQGIGVEVNKGKAFEYYLASAEGGYDEAKYRVGSILLDGMLGQPRNVRKAIQWFEHAAKNNHIDSIYNLGFLYENGTGILPNGKKALYYYKRAALLGDYQAKLNIARIFELGNDVPVDLKAAAKWRKVAESHMNLFN